MALFYFIRKYWYRIVGNNLFLRILFYLLVVLWFFSHFTIFIVIIIIGTWKREPVYTDFNRNRNFFQVNISNSWLLPQSEFPVFYRHFRDRVTWFEADAVCQFHHAQLATGKGQPIIYFILNYFFLLTT